jgi:hypothetical protein
VSLQDLDEGLSGSYKSHLLHKQSEELVPF